MKALERDDLAASGDAIDGHPELVVALREYQAAVDAGVVPDRQRLLARYPAVARELADCLDGLDLLQAAAPALQTEAIQAAPHVGPAVEGTLGDFRLIREIGRGGMGIVYEAQQISLDRRVALKVLPFAATFDARQLQRFKNEAQAAALLHHQHIVAVHAVGCERGVHFYAMQLVEGQSLAIIIRQMREQAGLKEPRGGTGEDPVSGRRPAHEPAVAEFAAGAPAQGEKGLRSTADVSQTLAGGGPAAGGGPFRKMARLMVQAAEALEHAHQLGVIHRDVKPANLLVNTAGNLWVTDFGLAQLQADTGLTRSGDLLGTIRYMSPEQTSGRRAVLDHRTDIYSLGATMYELLTLEPVFAGESRQELVYQILHQEPCALRLVNRAIPSELETIVLKALSKNPADRYGTAGELAADLQRYLDDQPIRARPPSLFDRARKYFRRHPSAVVAALLVLGFAAVALLISNRSIAREHRIAAAALALESRRADEEKLRANEAEAQLRQSRQAVDLLIQISEKELANEPISRPWRLVLLETALDYYQSFLDYQNVLEARRSSAEARSELTAMQERIDRTLRELTILKQETLILHMHLVMIMLWSPALQDDFGLTDRQRELAAELRQNWSDDFRRVSAESRDGTHEVRRRRFVQLAGEYESAINRLLRPEQRERVDQIGLQTAITFGFNGPLFLGALQLPAEPRISFGGLEYEAYSRMSDPLGPRPRERASELASLTLEAALLEVMTTLTKDWRASAGRPFEGYLDSSQRAGGLRAAAARSEQHDSVLSVP